MWPGVSMPRDPPKEDHPGTPSLGRELQELCLHNDPRRGILDNRADLQGSGQRRLDTMLIWFRRDVTKWLLKKKKKKPRGSCLDPGSCLLHWRHQGIAFKELWEAKQTLTSVHFQYLFNAETTGCRTLGNTCPQGTSACWDTQTKG